MLFQDVPPNTSAYMIAGYAIFFAISIIYMISLVVRRRNLEKDLQVLEAMEAEASPAPRSGRGKSGGGKPKSTKP